MRPIVCQSPLHSTPRSALSRSLRRGTLWVCVSLIGLGCAFLNFTKTSRTPSKLIKATPNGVQEIIVNSEAHSISLDEEGDTSHARVTFKLGLKGNVGTLKFRTGTHVLSPQIISGPCEMKPQQPLVTSMIVVLCDLKSITRCPAQRRSRNLTQTARQGCKSAAVPTRAY